MKVTIIKLSGKKLNEIGSGFDIVKLIQSVQQSGSKVILIHGGGKQITEWSKKLGVESEFIDGQRVTTDKVIPIVAAVQAGYLNKLIVAQLNKLGIDAFGISGIDGNSFRAEIVDENLGFVGKPYINGTLDWLINMINKNIVPVFASICMDDNGNLLNVNADYFVELIARELNAEEVYYFSDVNGVHIKDITVKVMSTEEIGMHISDGEITGGMIPKLLSAVELINNGVKKIWIGKDWNFDGVTGGTEIVKSY